VGGLGSAVVRRSLRRPTAVKCGWDDVEDAAKNGSADTKQKARELENKIERELDSRK
jgi:hypothetical protein